MHTTNSDWSKSESEIKEMVYKAEWLKVASITDHQYMTHKEAFEENSTLWIPGIEISASANGVPVHITWYGLKPVFTKNLRRLLQQIIDWYNDRATKIYNKWINEGLNVCEFDKLRDNQLPPPIYKSDLVRELWKVSWLQWSREIRDWAREKWNLLYIEEENFMPDVKELLPAMHESWLISCRAHPWKSLFKDENQWNKSLEIMNYIIDAGIIWIEPYAHKHTPYQTNFFKEFAKENKLLITWWSDYHWDIWHSISFPVSKEFISPFLEKIWYTKKD